jgi:hypothetical protein
MITMPTALIAFLSAAAIAAPQAPGLTFTAPPVWQSRPAASSMRVAEFVVPRTNGDSEDAEVIVYYFGGGGGSADANVERWIGQMEQPDGSGSQAKAVRSSLTANGLKLTTVDVSGTYVAEMRPGATEHFNKPGYRLRAAVIETPRGPYYVKMTGPARTVGAANADFTAFLQSLRFTGGA